MADNCDSLQRMMLCYLQKLLFAWNLMSSPMSLLIIHIPLLYACKMCFLSVYVLFLGCYVSLVHTQWAWNPVGMCLIWKFYPLGLVNSNRRLRTVLQCRQECRNGKSSAQRQQRAQVAVVPVLEGATVLKMCSLKLLCFLHSSVSAGKWGFGQLCFPLYP